MGVRGRPVRESAADDKRWGADEAECSTGLDRMQQATTATPEMAAYFLGALRDQSSRAVVFQRQMRWQRLRHALATEEAVVASHHLLDTQPLDLGLTVALPVPAAAGVPVALVTTSEEPAVPPQAAAG